MPTSFMIIDDFLDNPDEFRADLLNLSYPDRGDGEVYPGRNSTERTYIPNLDDIVSNIVGETLTPQAQTAHAKSRITLEGEKGLADIHIDSCYWSGILYMSRDENCSGGTDFFKHKLTGSDQATYLSEDLEKIGASTVGEARQVYTNILKNDGKNRSKWEHQMNIPMKYNRLLLLRPWLWHTAGPGFGSHLENGRLVYLMFFNNANAGSVEM